MDRLAEIFQTNPLIVILFFVVSVAAAITTVADKLRKVSPDLLSRKVTLPVYVYVIVLLIWLLGRLFWPVAEDRPKGLRTIKGEEFGVQRVIMDGKRFQNCTSRKTELVFRGEASSGIENCTLYRPGFTFDGPAAATARILTSLYKIPELRPLIDNTFESIRKGKLPRAIPPSDVADD